MEAFWIRVVIAWLVEELSAVQPGAYRHTHTVSTGLHIYDGVAGAQSMSDNEQLDQYMLSIQCAFSLKAA